MELARRKIILTNNRFEPQQFSLDGFQLFQNEYLFFDPIALFKELDWTSYENKTEIINCIYSKLFDGFVIENRTLICYWPTTNFPDNHWFKFLNHSKKAGIKMEINYLIEEENSGYELPTELQLAWKELVIEMIGSISEDIILNEGLEEIAQLKSVNSAFTIFSKNEENKLRYFYVSTGQEVFEFEPQYEFEKVRDSSYVELFDSFETLLGEMQSKMDLSGYEVDFMDNRMEKIYFNSLLKKNIDINLIQNWVESYSLN